MVASECEGKAAVLAAVTQTVWCLCVVQKPSSSHHHLSAHRHGGVRSHQPGLLHHALPRTDAQLWGCCCGEFKPDHQPFRFYPKSPPLVVASDTFYEFNVIILIQKCPEWVTFIRNLTYSLRFSFNVSKGNLFSSSVQNTIKTVRINILSIINPNKQNSLQTVRPHSPPAGS